MPLFHHRSSIRTQNDNSSLTLQVRHTLAVGEYNNVQTSQLESVSYNLKKLFPSSMDVLARSDIIFSLSATCNRRTLGGIITKESNITVHFVQMLRKNVTVLGINNVSDAYIDEEDGLVKVNVSPKRCTPPEDPRLQIILTSIHLVYLYNTSENHTSYTTSSCGQDFNLEILNQAVDRLLTYQIAKRYPLIFGLFGEKLEREKPYFRSIAQSISSMARRSSNDEFRMKFKRCIKVLRRRIAAFHIDRARAIEQCCIQSPSYRDRSNGESREHTTDEAVICEAMQHLQGRTVRQPLIQCTPVTGGSVPVKSNECYGKALSPCWNLEEDCEFFTADNNDDGTRTTEFEDGATSRTEEHWAFLSRPPIPEATIKPFVCIQDPGEESEDNFPLRRGTVFDTEEAGPHDPMPDKSDGGPWDSAVESTTGQDTRTYSDVLYDSDSDSLSISSREENTSDTLCLNTAMGGENTGTDALGYAYIPDEHETPASDAPRNGTGLKKGDFHHSASADRSCWRALSSTSGSARQPTSTCFCDADQELICDCDISLPPGHLMAVSPTDHGLYGSLLISGSAPVADISDSSSSGAMDEGIENIVLGYADEVEGEGNSFWNSRIRGLLFATLQDSHTPELVPVDVLCAAPFQTSEESDDQASSSEWAPDCAELGTLETIGVVDIPVQVDVDYDDDDDGDVDLEIEGWDDCERLSPSAMLRCNSSGRMDMILDSEDEEDGECQWSLFGVDQ